MLYCLSRNPCLARAALTARGAAEEAEDSSLDLFHSDTWVQCDRTDCLKWRAGTKRYGVQGGFHLTPLGLFPHASTQRIWGSLSALPPSRAPWLRGRLTPRWRKLPAGAEPDEVSAPLLFFTPNSLLPGGGVCGELYERPYNKVLSSARRTRTGTAR